jgi:hypothetical protein
LEVYYPQTKRGCATIDIDYQLLRELVARLRMIHSCIEMIACDIAW